jgi:ATP-dependent protease ClpP protease subunit
LPNWNEVLVELQKEAGLSPQDRVRRRFLADLSKYTKRNTIAYYSGWLQKPNHASAIMDDNDMNGFMTTIHQLDRTKGLDLILHTPGGNLASVESLVDYLRKMFDTDVRAFIPQLAMSAGTMLACSCKEIVMGKHSFMGPIDPQFNGISAEGVREEFEKAIEEVKKDPNTIPIWREIISKYHPTFIGDCEKAIEWSQSMVTKWLTTGMFKGNAKAGEIAGKIVSALSSHKDTLSHNRQISIADLQKFGLKVVSLEDDGALQDLVLTVHHAFMHTFSTTPAIKIIENHNGKAMVIFMGAK